MEKAVIQSMQRIKAARLVQVQTVLLCYCRVPSNVQFTLTAKATLESIEIHGQSSFGLMARDDMYIDKNDKAIKSDYVAAGVLSLDKLVSKAAH